MAFDYGNVWHMSVYPTPNVTVVFRNGSVAAGHLTAESTSSYALITADGERRPFSKDGGFLEMRIAAVERERPFPCRVFVPASMIAGGGMLVCVMVALGSAVRRRWPLEQKKGMT